MENRKLNKNISKIDFDSVNIDKYVESDIDEYIKYFNIDEESKNKIIIPTDLKKNVKEPFKEVKREKRKNIRYTFLDLVIVAIILLPVGGIINPKLFENLPTVYPVFKKINKAIQIDNIKSMMGIDNKEVIEGSADSSVETIFIEEKDISEPRNNNEAIKLIHSLANTLIKAEYKWQCSEVTPKTIKLAIKGVEKISDDYDRMHLRNSLAKWKRGDFSNAVEVHNYVWAMLNGNVGKAEALDNDAISLIIKKYYDKKEGEK